MKINFLNYEEIEKHINFLTIISFALYGISIYIVSYLAFFNIGDIYDTVINFTSFLILNFVSLFLLIIHHKNILEDYKKENFTLKAVNKILEEDKKILFKKIK